jgi:hypothetical protein
MKNKQLSYPYCIASAASAHIVRLRFPPTSKARQLSAAAPAQWWMRKKGILKPRGKKAFY